MIKLTSFLAIVLISITSSIANPFEISSKKPTSPFKKSSLEFMHSAGAGYVSASDGVNAIGGWAAAYTPRFSMTTSKESALGLSAPTLFAMSFSSFYGLSGVIDLPVMAEYSFGYGSTEKAYRNDFGMYLGAGAGITLISGGYGYGGTFANWNVGGGARFEFKEKPVDVRITYGKGFGNWSSVGKFTFGVSYILSYA